MFYFANHNNNYNTDSIYLVYFFAEGGMLIIIHGSLKLPKMSYFGIHKPEELARKFVGLSLLTHALIVANLPVNWVDFTRLRVSILP